MPFEFLEDIATADVAFEATGNTLDEAFSEAAKAAFSLITNLDGVKQIITKNIELVSEDLDSLLFDWIDELLFFWDSERLVFSNFHVKIREEKDKFILKAKVSGEEFDSERHEHGQNVKSPTYHMIKTGKEDGIWKLRMVLDL